VLGIEDVFPDFGIPLPREIKERFKEVLLHILPELKEQLEDD
jgi:hypothetical protein